MFPNLAIIEELKVEVFYIGEKHGPEEELVKKYHVPFYGIHAGKLRRYFDFKNFIDIFKIPLGFFEALKILRKLKPDLVFAKGGYVSVPVVFAAWILRIPVWLHESDVSPGLANRICSRFVKRIFLSFEESEKYFEGLAAARLVIGNPIRREILNGSPAKGYKLTGFSPRKPVLLIVGGSTGAQSLNKLVFKILPKLLRKVQVIHITGKNISTTYNLQPTTSYKSFPFLHAELAHIYAITDLAVSRAGSGGIFELLALHKPMILIPLPRAASRGDQIENARVFAKHGWAQMLEQDGLTPEKLLRAIIHFLENPERQKAGEKFTLAARRIADAIMNYR